MWPGQAMTLKVNKDIASREIKVPRSLLLKEIIQGRLLTKFPPGFGF